MQLGGDLPDGPARRRRRGPAPRPRPGRARTPRSRRTTSAGAGCAARSSHASRGRSRSTARSVLPSRTSTRRQAATESDAPGSSWARCQARRNDVTAPSTSPRSSRSSASIDRHARGSSPQVSSPATTGVTSSRARAGSLASTSRACSRSSQAWQSLRLSRGSASQAASSRSTPVVVADGLREPGPGRVHRPQVVAVGAEDLLDVVDGGHQGVEADLREVLDEVDGPLQPPQHGVAVVLVQPARPGRAPAAARRSAPGCAGPSAVQ